MPALVTTEQVAQDIYVMHALHPDDKLSVTMARLPYSMLTKVMALAYGNIKGMFTSDRDKDELVLKDYTIDQRLISDELHTVIDQMAEMAQLYADQYEEHVSVGQFCVWAQVGPEFFPLIREYAKHIADERVAFYSIENPYSTRGHEEEFIATPSTKDEGWGIKQFTPPKPKGQKAKKRNPKK